MTGRTELLRFFLDKSKNKFSILSSYFYRKDTLMNRLQDKVAIITGASSGVGKCIAESFAAEGAKVMLFARKENLLTEIVNDIKAKGGEASFLAGSVTDQKAVEEVFKKTVDAYGKVDIVVNDAGIGGYYGAADVPDKECYDLFDTNAMGSKYMLPNKKGVFVFIGSVGGLLGHAGAAYALSKGAMVNLARQVAVEYHLEGIRSNAICPDGIMTPFIYDFEADTWKNTCEEHVVKATTGHICAGTPLCQPEEVASLALFLASDESSAVNGQAIVCDHGANL